jgi:hypothetical protein
MNKDSIIDEISTIRNKYVILFLKSTHDTCFGFSKSSSGV